MIVITHEIEVYVRFAETDALGHVNNTSYFLYFEESRSKFFKTVFPDRVNSINFILASIKCDYLGQAFAAQTLKVCTKVKEIGNKSFRINHTLKEIDTEKTIAKGEAVIVCFNFSEQKTVPIPNVLRENLENYLLTTKIY